MPGLDPGIHATHRKTATQLWIAGSSPAMTIYTQEGFNDSKANPATFYERSRDCRWRGPARLSAPRPRTDLSKQRPFAFRRPGLCDYCLNILRRSSCARRASPISAMWRHRTARHGTARPRQSRFRHKLCVALHQGDRCRRADHALVGGDGRLLRAVREAKDPQHHRPERKERRATSPGIELARVADPDGRPGRARPGQGHPLDHRPKVKPIELFEQGKIDAFLGFPARATGSARPAYRSRHRQYRRGPPVVAIFLLYAGRQSGIRAAHPVATKRVMRAILKATDLCAADPAGVAQRSPMAASRRATIMRSRR